MTSNSMLDDIQDLNLSYLLLVQRLLREDRETALFRLKMTAEQANFLERLSSKQLIQLARSQQLICRFAFNDVKPLEQVLLKPRDHGMQQLHAALLMASMPCEQES